MWPGPYGDFGSRKYLIASLDQSLKRLGLDYVDIFYHHRPDPETPLEETMRALEHIVRSGRALYVGISSYDAQGTRDAAELLRGLGTPCIIHQPSYSMFNRWVEKGLLQETQRQQMGVIAFSPLAQGLLTDRYLKMVPQDSRIAKQTGFLSQADLTPQRETALRGLFELAQERGQTLAQLALSWVLRDGAVTSALIGASKISQVEDCIGALNNLQFTPEELARIDALAPSTS
ncbi:MAG TPA: aldo/keto reductase, partial [Polyangiaceae bacterium]|nr:aldo/keto reductase [Polyangiaceae bacterium]